MSDFNFRLNELDDRSEVSRKIMGNATEGLKTSASISKNGDPRDVTLFSMSQILMGSPAIKDPAQLLAVVQQKVLGGITLIADQLGDIPGLGALVPDVLKDIVEDARPEGSPEKWTIRNTEGDFPEFTGAFASASDPYINRVISIAKSDLNYKENPVGSDMQKFADNVDHKNGHPWAMTFIMSAFKDAGISQSEMLTSNVIGSYDSAFNIGRTGDVARVGAIALFHFPEGAIVPYAPIQPSPISGILANHAGLVYQTEDKVIRTIEGDVSSASTGNQKGSWVKEKRRAKSDVVGYIYPVYPDGEIVAFPPDPDSGDGGVEVDPVGFSPSDEISRGAVYSFPSNYQVATSDSGGEKPGARALMDYLTNRFPLSSDVYGIYNYRHIGNDPSNDLSTHSEGRALDVKVPETDAGKRTGDQMFLHLSSHFVQLGIQAVAWYNRWYSGNSPDGRSQSGHTDHLHIELTREAAAGLTAESINNILNNSIPQAV